MLMFSELSVVARFNWNFEPTLKSRKFNDFHLFNP